MKKKYTFLSKFSYGLIDIVGGGSFSLISLLFLNFLVTVEGISPALAGTVVMVGKLWDAVTDPLMGIITDRTRSRFGRRRIYLLLAIIPIFVTFSLLWYSFGITSMTGKFIYYAAMYILFSTAYTIMAVPYNALLPDMVDSYQERTGYSSIRIFVSNLSATISVTVPSLILGPEATRTTRSYLVMGIVFGAFFALPLLIGFFATWENPIPDSDEKSTTPMDIVRQLRDSFRNRAYRQYLGIFCFGQIATDLATAMTAFWLADILRRQGMLTLFSGVVMITGICMLPLNNWIGKKYGKHYPAFLCMPFRVLGLFIAFFMGAGSPLTLLILTCVFIGVGTGASSFVPWSLLPDLPDSDEMITGRRNAGIYAGMSTLIRKSTSGIAIFFAGVVLQMFGYVESTTGTAAQQTSTALLCIRIMFSILPILFSFVAIWLGYRYTLTKSNHEAVCKAISHKREKGTATADPAVISACEKVSGHQFDSLWAGRAESTVKQLP